jgi:hypothetical protein
VIHLQAKECQGLPATIRNGFSFITSTNTMDVLILDGWLPELRENTFLMFFMPLSFYEFVTVATGN